MWANGYPLNCCTRYLAFQHLMSADVCVSRCRWWLHSKTLDTFVRSWPRLTSLPLSLQVYTEEEAVQSWWEESMRLLADFHFVDMLLSYDRDAMSEDVVAKVGRQGIIPHQCWCQYLAEHLCGSRPCIWAGRCDIQMLFQ